MLSLLLLLLLLGVHIKAQSKLMSDEMGREPSQFEIGYNNNKNNNNNIKTIISYKTPKNCKIEKPKIKNKLKRKTKTTTMTSITIIITILL